MSYKCAVCGKGSSSGNTVSHSNKASKRLFRPNLQSLNIVLNGKKAREYVCTSCIKSNKIKKAIYF
jgi:large subunit ribosomal protein L28